MRASQLPLSSCSTAEQGKLWRARVPWTYRGKISLVSGIHCCHQVFFFNFFCPTTFSILWRPCIHTHTHTHISDTVQTVHELPLLPNNTAVKHLYTNRSGTKCWLDIYRKGAGLTVTGRIRDTGQNVLEPSFQKGSSSSPIYCQILFLIAFLEEAFIRNTTIRRINIYYNIHK